MYVNSDSASATIILSLDSLNAQLNQTEYGAFDRRRDQLPRRQPDFMGRGVRRAIRRRIWGVVANEIEGVYSPELTTATGALSSVLSTLDDMQTDG